MSANGTTGKGAILRSLPLFFLVGLLFILAAMPVSAALTNPLQSGLEMMGRVLYIDHLSTMARQGILLLAVFVIVFALSNYGLNKVFNGKGDNPSGKKTAGIISFAFSLMGTIAAPSMIFDANVGLMSGIILSTLMGIVFIGGGMYAVLGLPTKENKDHPYAWVYNLVGLALIMFLFSVLHIWIVTVPIR